ncbi:MAG: thioredoxin family protein [Campylobacterales bacterium]
MKIEVLGTGCAKCKDLFERAKTAIAKSGKFVQLEKVEDVMKIMTYGIASTPALVIDGEVKCAGRLPTVDEILKWIEGN